MPLKSWVARKWAKRRVKQIQQAWENPFASQEQTLFSLLRNAASTQFGTAHDFSKISSVGQFREKVPVKSYEEFLPWIEKIVSGETDVTWPGKPMYLAKTSGTTAGAKFIPLTKDSMKFQVRGARDTLLSYIHWRGNASFVNGKMLFLSGSPELEKNEAGLLTGRLSGIVNHFIPSWLKGNQVPSFQINCIEDWEKKIAAIADETIHEDLRLLSGIPPWVQMFLEVVEKMAGRKIQEVWPNLSVYVEGGVDYGPYRDLLEPYFTNRVDVVEVFPASEGYFAFQSTGEDGLLFNLESGMYFEFIPLHQIDSEKKDRYGIHEVKSGEVYVLVVSSNAGLWGYNTGDLVKVISMNPVKFKVVGRQKNFLSPFGEHVIEEEVNKSMQFACTLTGAVVSEFHVAPVVLSESGSSHHEWWIEFHSFSGSESDFLYALDQKLQDMNLYYRELRAGNIISGPRLRKLARGGCAAYLNSIGKLGGQNKFPRLRNDRNVAKRLEAWEMKPEN